MGLTGVPHYVVIREVNSGTEPVVVTCETHGEAMYRFDMLQKALLHTTVEATLCFADSLGELRQTFPDLFDPLALADVLLDDDHTDEYGTAETEDVRASVEEAVLDEPQGDDGE